MLTPAKIPYNPMINSGAIMTASMVGRTLAPAERFESMLSWWKRLGGGFKPGFDNSTYLSEKGTADMNFAMAHLMKSVGSFPEGINISEALDFYFQNCSIQMNTNSLAVVAATFANGGVCPLTHERVLTSETTRNTLSLMFSCGMYDYSGQFAFKVGLPAKSGVSGAILFVIPGICGIAIWSPRLDSHGNSVRGIEFCEKLVENFSFHNFDIFSPITLILSLRKFIKFTEFHLVT
jgi:glutaminase